MNEPVQTSPARAIDILNDGIQGVDSSLSWRLQTLLHVVPDISLRRRGNVFATMASLKDNRDTLDTRLYIVFNCHDKQARSCSLTPLRCSSGSRSPKDIAGELENNFIEICRAIHNYSFDAFARRVTKRECHLAEIREYIA